MAMWNPTSEDPLFWSAPEALSPQQREKVRQYIRSHPELRQHIQALITAVVASKPDNPLAFAHTFFKELA
jgi:hypothetical protein